MISFHVCNETSSEEKQLFPDQHDIFKSIPGCLLISAPWDAPAASTKIHFKAWVKFPFLPQRLL